MKRAPTSALAYDLSALLLLHFNLDTIFTQRVGHDVPVLTAIHSPPLRSPCDSTPKIRPMPKNNKFAHQAYTAAPPRSRFEILPFEKIQGRSCSPTTDPERFSGRMREVGRVLREAGVTQLYLVHGTFVGTDPS